MASGYVQPRFSYRRPPELGTPSRARHPVVVIGAGPIGMTAAIDLAQQGIDVVLLDEDDTVSAGSRGLCYARRTLEVFDRLGCGEPITSHGVSWHVGRTFFGDAEVFRFDLQPEADFRRPAMVNLQQYHLEEHLVRRIAQLPRIDLRWRNRVVSAAERELPVGKDPGNASAGGAGAGRRGVELEVETPDGRYRLFADWLIVADGARSPIRKMLGLDVEGKVFTDRFLIADVFMHGEFPAERWFWFDPPFHRGQSVLLHRQADNVWRIDFQLGWDADPEEARKPENVIPRIRAMLGPKHEFELEWVSVYTFQCRRMREFRKGRFLFVGDAAHQVSPFGARGANSGVQDVDNLVWKLVHVMRGQAPETLLDSYGAERGPAADENILNSTRSTDFITPKSHISRVFRDATLELARKHRFARALVNSGRLSTPTFLVDSPLNTADTEAFASRLIPGAPIDDGPITGDHGEQWLLEATGGRFQALVFASDPSLASPAMREGFAALAGAPLPVEVLVIADLPGSIEHARVLVDRKGLIARRYDARDGTTYVLRPDQHVCARFRRFDPDRVRLAVRRATCNA